MLCRTTRPGSDRESEKDTQGSNVKVCSSCNEKWMTKVRRSNSPFLGPGGRKCGWFLSGLIVFGAGIVTEGTEGVGSLGTTHRTRR